MKGYIWGRPVKPLLDALRTSERASGFDLIILSDLIFNHSQVGQPLGLYTYDRDKPCYP